MSGIVTPTDVELAAAWASQDLEQLSVWFCSDPNKLDPWITGSWREPASDFIRRSMIPSDDARLVDLFRLAQRSYERLWREGRAFQPGWWRDVIIPELLQYMIGPTYDKPPWWRPAVWDTEESLPDGWRDVEPWLQGWMDNLIAFYRREPQARQAGDRLGFYRPFRPDYLPATHFMVVVRLINHSIRPVLQSPNGVCFAQELYAHLVQLALAHNDPLAGAHQARVSRQWAISIAKVVRDIPRNPPVPCDASIPTFDKLLQDVRAEGIID